MVKIYFRVLPVADVELALAWQRGDVDDPELIQAAASMTAAPAVWYVMHLGGGAAGGRQCLAWMRAAAVDGCQAFIWRTGLYGLARLAERWQGQRGWREEDGRERWWIPAACVSSRLSPPRGRDK